MKHLAILGALLAVLAVATGSAAARGDASSAPANLHAFLLRVDEPVAHTYPRTPAFAWEGVRGATSYEFQLSTSRAFTDATIVWKDSALATPTAAIDLQLPWMTGEPYALWAHVRAVVDGHTTAWGNPFGFNMRWETVPRQLPSPMGLVRWTPVDGATGYEVWFPGIRKHFSTVTNVADEREFFMPNAPAADPIRWRVRAVRYVASSALPNSLDRVSHGPYTQQFTAADATWAAGPLHGGSATSDGTSTATKPIAHQLTPGFAWQGSDGVDGTRTQLWRTYVATDRQCVNIVMKGAVVGGPAWAPRTSAPAQKSYMADGTEVIESESSDSGASGAGTGSTGATAGPSSAGSSGSSNPPAAAGAHIDLWDIGWPSGRYWWTVVPVVPVPTDTGGAGSSSGPSAAPSEYIDTELPEDACAAGRVWSFGKVSAPVATRTATPFVSGMVSGRRVTAAAHKLPRFRFLPLIAWQPALGAQLYDVEVSRTTYPWKATIQQQTHATSLVLPLNKNQDGTWYYRVRGVNPNLPNNAQTMSWSRPVPIRITGDVFTVAK